MLHAPSSENKPRDDAVRAHSDCERARERELQPQPAAAQTPAWPAATEQHSSARLQQTYGNQAVLRSLDDSGPTLQAKLTVNQPGDVFEQEADSVADQVMRMQAPAGVQRRCAECKQEEKLQRKCAHCEEEEKKAQRKEGGAGPAVAPPGVHEVLRASGQPLDAAARAFMEPRFGHDFSHVRVHADEKAAESARSLNARAYTVGRNIVFGQGEYASARSDGRKLLAHELTHVLQQAGESASRDFRGSAPSAYSAAVQTGIPAGTVQRDKKPAAPSAKLGIKVDGKKSADDKLTFPSKTTCSQDLGLHDCSSNQVWLWSVEIQGDTSDDVSQWDVAQSFTGKKKGVTKDSSGSSHKFDVNLNEPNDVPDSNFLQQNSGDKKLFWIDAPGHSYARNGEDVDSMTQVQNFISKICNKTSSKVCAELKWFVKLVIKPGGQLDTKASKAGTGTETTKI